MESTDTPEGPESDPHRTRADSDPIPMGETVADEPYDERATVASEKAAEPRAEPARLPWSPPIVTRERFEHALFDAGLMTADALREFLHKLPPDRLPADGERLARELVRAGRLTRYQAAAVYQGKTKGLVIGPYEVLDKLGAGGMGMVFKARHRARRNVVALKLLPPSIARNVLAVRRFEREAQAMARLNHPHVVSILDIDESQGAHFLVMDYVEGVDLGRFVQEKGPLPLDLATHCVAQAARGLQAAHDQGIIHRDIKPANLLLDRQGTVRVLDLGLARLTEGADGAPAVTEGLTKSGTFLGTIDFLSPEQASDSKRVNYRADIYSLGCTLYFLLTGRPPYQGRTMLAQLVAHREEPVPSVRNARADVPEALDRLCRRMLAKAPNDRPQAMAEVAAELEAIRAGLGRGRERSTPSEVKPPGEATTAPVIDLHDLLIDIGPPAAGSASPLAPEDRQVRGRTQAHNILVALAALSAGIVALTVGLHLVRPPVQALPAHPPPAVVAASPAPKPSPPPRPIARGGPLMEEVLRFSGHESAVVRAVAVAPDGQQALSCGDDATVRLWNIKSGKELHRFEGHRGPVLGVAFAPNGLEGISCGEDGWLILWDLETYRETSRIKAHDGGATSVAFAPDGGRALSGGADHLVRLWDLSSGQRIGQFVGHDRPINAVAFSPDDLHALSASEKALRLWNLKSQKEIGELKGHRGPVWCVAFSSDGQHALSAGADGSIRYWDVKTRSPLKLLEEHQAPVRAVAIAPDGSRALSADEKGSLILWNLDAGRKVQAVHTVAFLVTDVAFLHDGLHAVTAGDDGSVRLWNLPEPRPRGPRGR